jgi:hypothetical protein
MDLRRFLGVPAVNRRMLVLPRTQRGGRQATHLAGWCELGEREN